MVKKVLFKNKSNQMIGGVAAGLAEYFDTDVSLIRLAIVCLVPITGGFAILAYVVAMIILPNKEEVLSNGKKG